MTRLHKLWHVKKHLGLPQGATRMNCLAAVICLMSAGILVLSFQATPAGAGLDAEGMADSMSSTPVATAPAVVPVGDENEPQTLSVAEINQRIDQAINGSRVALHLHVALLELGRHRIERFPDYSATFFKQEKLDGEDIQEMQICQLKMRHEPFSVYMKWLEGGDVGRQVLYVNELHDGKMLVKLGGRKGTLLPILKLDPDGSLALKEARHPVTEMGLLKLADLIIKYRKRDLSLKQGVRWQMLADQKFLDHDCYCFVVEYDSKEIEPVYRKSITYIDKVHSLPVGVKNFGWPTVDTPLDDPQGFDEATLIENYGYKDLSFETRLSDADFDKANADYKFRR